MWISDLECSTLRPDGPRPQPGGQQTQSIDQNLQTAENPNDIQSFEVFMSRFGKIYSSSDEQSFRQDIFIQNLGIINVSFKQISILRSS